MMMVMAAVVLLIMWTLIFLRPCFLYAAAVGTHLPLFMLALMCGCCILDLFLSDGSLLLFVVAVTLLCLS